MITELQEMMRAQFTASPEELNRFEARIMAGCHQLCTHVHQLAGEKQEVRAGVVSLIGTVKEIAGTVNTTNQSLTAYQGSLGSTQENLTILANTVQELEALLTTNRRALEGRVGGLEQACMTTAASLANQLSAQIKDFSETLKGFKDT
jgi:uncharacterized phage infection (PIP) family protein YhgE